MIFKNIYAILSIRLKNTSIRKTRRIKQCLKIGNFTITLCPTAEQAKALNPDVTIEAEYGDLCVEGSVLTLAHHGSRSSNPAPCNTNVTPLTRGSIVISHMDLDTICGIMAVVGEKK